MTENATAPRPVIVAGVDGSPTSREALRWAAEEARLRTATLRVVCGWEWSSPFNLIGPALEYAAPDADTPSMEELTRAKVEELLTGTLGEEPGVPVEVRVVQGPATRVLVDASEGATLIVVGTRGHSGIKGAVLGSVSRHVTQHARCNVVVVRDSRTKGKYSDKIRTGTDKAKSALDQLNQDGTQKGGPEKGGQAPGAREDTTRPQHPETGARKPEGEGPAGS
ncbi:universal stress protein [Streptomyces sp. McG5]|uniref:Rv0909 family putative TA system antitoxin n=1 Tax=Streptomyces sp. McG5 TaxID=2725484 RepID=UPI0027E4F499|nr:Rv0909 family putative TA system antitoxin [Streptomyces sp. McG5]MBT2888594.1 universal stress protein [Streptomyces sp. McG5]